MGKISDFSVSLSGPIHNSFAYSVLEGRIMRYLRNSGDFFKQALALKRPGVTRTLSGKAELLDEIDLARLAEHSQVCASGRARVCLLFNVH